jgi:folate-binding protein YgfZ
MTIHTALLEDRGVLRVSGEDATGFLQGLLTNDVEKLAVGEARYAALLSPQGKILFDFLVVRIPAKTGAAFLIDCPGAQAADLAKRLGFYRLRAKVTVTDESAERGVIAFWEDDASEPTDPMTMVRAILASSKGIAIGADEAAFYVDPRDPRLGSRAIMFKWNGTVMANAPFQTYDAHRIGLGVPSGGVDFAYADIFPHDANLDLLHGVDFKKGCYVGQEVVSRMHHRGDARKRIVRLTLDGAAPEPGTPIVAGDMTLGALGSASDGFALALLRLDRVEDAAKAGRALTAGGIAVTVK